VNDSWALYDDRYEVAWACSAAVRPAWACGGSGPLSGWVAPSLGVRTAAPRLELNISMTDVRATLVTVLADRTRSRQRSDQRAIAIGRADDRRLLARIALDGFVDEAVIAIDGSPDSTLLITRSHNGNPGIR
jgi:hypothetical protein